MHIKTYGYLKITFVLLTVALIAGCTDYPEGTEATRTTGTNRSAVIYDQQPPTMVSITPAYGTKGVALNTPIQAVFSEAIDPMSFDVELVNYSANTIHPVTAELSEDGTTIVVSTDEPLQALSIHGLWFQNVTDLAGNPLEGEYRSLFRTEAGS